MTLRMYSDLLSQPSRAVMLFLLTNKIIFEDKRINLTKAEHKTKEFEKLNPFYKVPVIDDNGFILKESVGILRYLCREKNVPDHWYPKDSKEQALVDEYLEWQHLDTRLNCSMYFMVKYLIPHVTGNKPGKKELAKYERKLIITLDLIENIWLKNNPYLTGNSITIADILGACEIEQPKMAGYDPKKGRPKLSAWMKKVRKDLSPYYDEVHHRVYQIAAKSSNGKSSENDSSL